MVHFGKAILIPERKILYSVLLNNLQCFLGDYTPWLAFFKSSSPTPEPHKQWDTLNFKSVCSWGSFVSYLLLMAFKMEMQILLKLEGLQKVMFHILAAQIKMLYPRINFKIWLDDSEKLLNTNLRYYVTPTQLFAVCFHDPISRVEAQSFDVRPTTLTNNVCSIQVIHGCYCIIILYI